MSDGTTRSASPRLANGLRGRHRPDGPGRDRLARRLGRRRHAPRAGGRSTASPTCSSTWRSRAPSAARAAPSPRRSRRSAATSTPTPRASSTAYLRQGAEGGHGARRSTSSPTSCRTRPSSRRSWSASAASSCRRSARPTTRPTTSSSTISRRRAFPDQPIGRPVLGTGGDHPAACRATIADRLHAPATTRAAEHGASPPPATLDHEQHRRPRRTRTSPTCRATAAPARRAGALRRRRAPRGARSRAGAPRAGLSRRVGYRDPDYYAAAAALDRCSAAACPRGCSRRCARSAAWSTAIYSLRPPYRRWRPVRHLCRHRRERGRGAGAGALRRAAQGRRSTVTEAELARARAQLKAGAADVAGEHRQRAASSWPGSCRCSAASSRPRRRWRKIERGDHGRRAARGGPASSAPRPTLAAMGPAGRVPALPAIADRLAA